MLELLDKAMLDAYTAFLAEIDNRFTQENVFLSIVDDDGTNRLLYERKQKKKGEQVQLPYAILVRQDVSSEFKDPSSAVATEQNIYASSDTGSGTTIELSGSAQILVEYKLVIIDNKFSSLTHVLEKWILRSGRKATSFKYAVKFGTEDLEIPINIVIGKNETVRATKSTARESGLVYQLAFPLTARTAIYDDPVDSNLILKTTTSFYVADQLTDDPRDGTLVDERIEQA